LSFRIAEKDVSNGIKWKGLMIREFK